MPKLFNADGEEVDVLSPEELENQTAALLTAKEQEFEAERKILVQKMEELEKKDLNFSQLRESKGKIEAELTEIKQKHQEEQEILATKRREELIKSLAEGDEELKKKIEFHIERINEPDVEKRVNDALKLAMGDLGMNSASVFSSAGGGVVNTQGMVPENLQQVAKNMGINDKDLGTYWQKAKSDPYYGQFMK